MTGSIIIENRIDISARPERIWEHLVDWEHLDRWMLEGQGFRVTSAEREGVGVTAEATISIGGIKTTDPVYVSRWEPPHLLEIRHLGWVKGKGVMSCEPRAGKTRLTWVETLEPPWGLVGAIGLRLFRPLLARTFSRDLKVLKGLVESPSPTG